MRSKTRTVRSFRHLNAARWLALPLFLPLAPAAQAADTWDGGGDDALWSNATNWVGDAAPTLPASLIFSGSTRLAPTNDLPGATVTNLAFATGAGAFTLGGLAVTLGGNISVNAGGSVTNDQTLDLPVTLGKNVVLSSALVGGATSYSTKGALIINGTISGPFGLTTSGQNYIQFNGANTYTGDTVISASNPSGNNSFSIGHANAFGTGKVIFGATAGSGTHWVQSVGNITLTNDVEMRTFRFVPVNYTVAGKTAGNLTLSGNVLLNHGSSGDFWCQRDLTLSGTVSGSGLRMATGKVILTGTNTFTDPLRSTDSGNVPTFNINSDAAMGHTNNGVQAVYSMNFQTADGTAITLAPSRSFTSYAGRTLTFDIPATSTLTVPGPVVNNGTIAKSGSGALTLAGSVANSGGITLNSGTLTLSGANTYSGGTLVKGGVLSITTNAALGAENNPLSFTASATLRGGATNVSLAADRILNLTNASAYTATLDVPTNFTLALAGPIKGNVATNSSLSKTGAGTLILAGGTDVPLLGALGTLEGKMSITNGAWAIHTASKESEDATPFWVAGGATFEQTGGSLSLPRWVYLGVRWSADPTTNKISTILLSGGAWTQASGGGLLVGRKNSAVLTVSGDAFLSLPSTLSLGEFAGFTTVCNLDGGVVAVPRILSRARLADGPNSLTAILNLNGGTLRATSSERLIGGSGTDMNQHLTAAHVKSGGAVIDSQTYTISINQVLKHDPDLGAEPDGGLIKRGTGSLTLSTNATYTGVTSIEAGTLKLGVAQTLMADNRVLVSSNAVLDVNGTAQTLATLAGSGLVTNNSLLAVTAGVAPGGTNAVGTLTLAATPASLSGTLVVDVATNGVCDRLHVNGDLNITALTLSVANPGALQKYQKYVIATWTGTLAGPFLSAPLPNRWLVKYDTAARKVYLVYDFGTLIMVR